ncbi:hypothetical protein ARMGADRAFT_942110, partial [Armillaria gallica]
LEVILDVDVCWSSTHFMIERALVLREAIRQFLSMDDFQDLLHYSLLPDKWTLLELMNEVLEISHAFQQQLSAEKRPTLCDAIPSFAAMTSLWEEMKVRHPVLVPAIKAGLKKLSDYVHRTLEVLAYVLSMGMCIFCPPYLTDIFSQLSICT